MFPYTCPAKYISGGQQEKGHGVVHHVQGEQHQSYLLQHYQKASIQDRQIGWTRMDQMLIPHLGKDTVEPYFRLYLNRPPSLVKFIILTKWYITCHLNIDGIDHI